MGSLLGIAIAAVLLIGLPEVFRDLAEYRMVAFGAGLVMIMIWRPRGLLSHRSEEHTSELQSLMRNSYAVFCLKKQNNADLQTNTHDNTTETVRPPNDNL